MALGDATIAVPNSTGGNQLSTDVSSLLALFGGLTGSPQANQIAQSADPWGPQRAQYQTQLNQFMANPASIFTDPAFQAAQQVGAENISRQAGAAGMGSSGNRLADLFSFGQSSALNFEQQRYNELANLAGVNAGSPIAAAGLQLGNLRNQGTNLASGLAGVLPMLAQLFGLAPTAVGGMVDIVKQLFGGGGGDPLTIGEAGGSGLGGDSVIPQITDPSTGMPIDIVGGGSTDIPWITGGGGSGFGVGIDPGFDFGDLLGG